MAHHSKRLHISLKNQIEGFTLVEIMIVVTIIALLATIAIPNLMRARVQANESAAQSTLRTISSSLENFYALNNEYPIETTSLIGATPPYLNVDYFSGTRSGYTFSASLAPYSYQISAVPIGSSHGTHSYTISTGAVLQAF